MKKPMLHIKTNLIKGGTVVSTKVKHDGNWETILAFLANSVDTVINDLVKQSNGTKTRKELYMRFVEMMTNVYEQGK